MKILNVHTRLSYCLELYILQGNIYMKTLWGKKIGKISHIFFWGKYIPLFKCFPYLTMWRWTRTRRRRRRVLYIFSIFNLSYWLPDGSISTFCQSSTLGLLEREQSLLGIRGVAWGVGDKRPPPHIAFNSTLKAKWGFSSKLMNVGSTEYKKIPISWNIIG